MSSADHCPFDPLSMEDHDNAAARLAEARAQGPVTRPYPGVNVVVRDKECREVLLNPEAYSNHFNFILEAGPAPEERTGDYKFITRIDPPDHGLLRKYLLKWFAPRALRALEHRVKDIVAEVVDRLPTDRPVDLFHELAHVVPGRVVYQMLGLPRSDWDLIQKWADESNDSLPKQNLEAAAKVRDYLSDLIDERLKSGERSDDVIDGFLYPDEDAPATVREDVLQHVRQLIAAGTDTTSALITNLIYRLLEEPRRWEQVRQDRGLLRAAVEESLRLDAPIQYTLRTAKQDSELAGCPVKPRDRLVVSLQSANWDEEAWGPDAAVFRLDRPGAAGHISFGSGIHACLGAPLARIEGRLVLSALLDRFPNARFAPDYQWVPVKSIQIRRPADLMVVLEPSTSHEGNIR